MRRLRTVGAIAVLALATCNVALADRGDPKRALTKADQARAKAMLLKRTDLAPGFRPSPSSNSPDLYCKALDESDLTVTGHAESPEWVLQSSTRFFFVSSNASIYRSERDAAASWRRGTSPAGEACAKRLLGASFAGTGGKVTLRSFDRQSFPKVAPLTVAYRLTASVTAGANTLPLYFDVVVEQRGRAQVSIVIGSIGAPLARAETVQFARLLSGRMAKAMKGA